MIKLILLLLYLSLIIAVIFVERKSPTEALLWVFVLICLPYLGAVLYLIFGSTFSIKRTAYLRNKKLEKLQLEKAKQPQHLNIEHLSDEDKQVMHFNAVYNDSLITSYQDAQVYIDGKSHYTQLFRDLKQAKQSIYIEFYTIHHDEVGQALVDLLTAKAKEGITIYVLCDFIANLSTPKKMFQPLLDAGGKLIRVKPYLTHYRLHRKIVVIDNQIGYIGGMNIGKQYANMAKKKNPWRDTQVRLTGCCVNELMNDFLKDYLCAIKQKQWDQTLTTLQTIPTNHEEMQNHYCQFVMGGVNNDKEAVKMGYLSMIRSAQKHIRIQTPYFIPDASILDALKTAAAAGVEIELMIPGIKASFFLDPVTNYYCGQLLEYGAKVHKYNGYIHAKTMVVDDELCCIGSVNMDMRSLMVDDEILGIFYDNQFVKQYIEIYKQDCFACRQYTYQHFLGRSIKEKICASFFLLFAPLM